MSGRHHRAGDRRRQCRRGLPREYAAATAARLRHRIRTHANVLRDGLPVELPNAEIVPGDVVRLSAGSLGARRRDRPRVDGLPRQLTRVIGAARRAGKPIGICGQAPSDYPEFADWLVEQGIDSISLNPDAAIRTAVRVAAVEARQAMPIARAAG